MSASSSSEAFTPGPWAWRGRPGYANLESAHGPVINYYGYEGLSFEVDHQEANARLIAAAPDLLKALNGLICLCEVWMNNGTLDRHKSCLDVYREIAASATSPPRAGDQP